MSPRYSIPLLSLFIINLALLPTYLAINIPTLTSGWAYAGCLLEPSGSRIMNETFFRQDSMTIQWCVTYCSRQGLPYAGLEWEEQCFCGSSLTAYQPDSDSSCDYKCKGDLTQNCGGWAHMSFFTLASKAPSGAVLSGGGGGVTTTTPNAAPIVTSSTVVTPTTPSSPAVSQAATVTFSAAPSILTTTVNGTPVAIAAPSTSVISASLGSSSPQAAVSGSQPASGSVVSGVGYDTSSSPTSQRDLLPQTVANSNPASTPNFKDQSQGVIFGALASGGNHATRSTFMLVILGCVLGACSSVILL